MIRTIRFVRLKTGERLRVAALKAPAGRYAAAIRKFLEHKGQPWLMHVDMANEGRTDSLNTTYYVGLFGGAIVGNVMIVDDGRAGILGHVFTAPEHRRKGIAQTLVAAATQDFAARGGLAMGLGTGFDSPAYWIYHRAGFRGVAPGDGHMLFESRPGALDAYFAPARVHATEALWHHWPAIALLYMYPGGDRVRSYAYGVLGPEGFEGGFLDMMRQRQKVAAQCKVLETRAGSVVGAVILQRDTRWRGHVHTLDLFVHPAYSGAEARLRRAVEFPQGGKVQAWLDLPSAARLRALRAAGFRHEATLRGQLERGGQRSDVVVLSRRG